MQTSIESNKGAGQGAALRRSWGDWALSLGTIACISGVLVPLRSSLTLLDVALVYLLGIVLVSSRTGRPAALTATFLSVVAFDFLFVPPAFFFSFMHPRYLFTDAVMLIVANVTIRLTLRIRAQAAAALRREGQTATLLSLSRELAGSAGIERLSAIAVRHVEEVVPGRAAIVLGDQGAPQALPPGDGAGLLRFTLRTTSRTLGELRVTLREGAGPLEPAQTSLLESFAGQAALALERAMLVDEARRAALKAEREAMRGTLLRSVSHDLRTPLAAIVGAATALQAEEVELSPQARGELLQTIADEGQHLDRIIRNLLAMTRLESSLTPPEMEVQSIEELVGAALERLGGRLEGRGLRLDIPASLPLVSCDPVLIGLVVVNLLENALVHTPPGTPLELSARSGGGEVLVELADRGPGIPAGAQESVFEKFIRGSTRTAGLGLGLAICRAIVGMHGGRIWVRNRDGGGAVFSFALPAGPAAPAVGEEAGEGP